MHKLQFKFTIPDHFYQYGRPELTDYMGSKGEGIAHKVSPEELYECRAAWGQDFDGWIVSSLKSPYITGFDFPYYADQLRVVSVDIDKREVVLEVVK